MFSRVNRIKGSIKMSGNLWVKKFFALFICGCIFFIIFLRQPVTFDTIPSDSEIGNIFADTIITEYNETFQEFELEPVSESKQTHIKHVEKKMRIILANFHHGGLLQQARMVNMNACADPNCVIGFVDGENHPLEPSLTKADAVLFQGGRMPDIPPIRRNPDQVYVFLDVEAPLHLHFNHLYARKPWVNAFNWTMTYRRDSDIPYPYGSIVKRSTPNAAGKDYSAIFARKRKKIAWLVSDCPTEGKREQYVTIMKKYIPVDVYGDCGALRNCSKSSKGCIPKIIKDYMFYLSFENSVCKDYVTEKVFNWFDEDIITVVRGGMTYNKILPAGTYINADDFNGAKELALYLKKVSTDETLYTNFLKRKEPYRVIPMKQLHQLAYCNLCHRLNNLSSYRKTYKYMGEWWLHNKCVRNPLDIH